MFEEMELREILNNENIYPSIGMVFSMHDNNPMMSTASLIKMKISE